MPNEQPTVVEVQGILGELSAGVELKAGTFGRCIIYPAFARLFAKKPLTPRGLADYHGVKMAAGKVRRWLQEDHRKGRTCPRWEEGQQRNRLQRPAPDKEGNVWPKAVLLKAAREFDVDGHLQAIIGVKRKVMGLEGTPEGSPRFFSMGCVVDHHVDPACRVRILHSEPKKHGPLRDKHGREVTFLMTSMVAEPITPFCPFKEEL